MRSRAQQLAVERAAKVRAFVDNFKINAGCNRCGYAEHPVALHFNHLDPLDKVMSVSKLASKGVIKNVVSEMEKCEVLCANCHAIHTYANKHHIDVAKGEE
jgi:hypothetical protein